MEEKNRQELIRSKGFDIYQNRPVEYGKIKVGVKTLEDATVNLGALQMANKNYGDKSAIMRALG